VFKRIMQLRAGKLYGMTIVSADAWQMAKVHIAYVSDDWSIPALEIRPERKFADLLGLRTRRERERCLLSTSSIGSVGNFVLLRTPVAKTADYIIRPDKPPMALPWVLWMPVVSHDGENLGIVEDAYIDTNIWKVDTLTFLIDRRPYQKLKTLNPANMGRRIEVPSSLAILGDVILLKVRTLELKALLKKEASQNVSAAGTPEGV
jgi:sporulation protein YlmC with PRC-barrel domain